MRLKEQLRKDIHATFSAVKGNKYFQILVRLSLPIRIFLFILLGIWSLFAMLTPVPAGWITLALAFAILFGIRPVKRFLVRAIYFLRIPFFWEKYKIRRLRKKNSS